MTSQQKREAYKKISNLQSTYFEYMDEKNKAYTWTNCPQEKKQYRQLIIEEMKRINKKIRELTQQIEG
tara:strand:- start:2152 stop:2355 length:204 start_codon:yes stop_codon:yes gene_type:complete